MRFFTPQEDNLLLANYTTMPLKRLARQMGRTEGTARQRLQLLGYKVPAEISRAKAMAVIATQIVNGAKTKVDAYRLTSKGEIPTLKLIGD